MVYNNNNKKIIIIIIIIIITIIIIIIIIIRLFSVVGPLVWNGLPLALWSFSRLLSQKFLQQLKTTLFGRAGIGRASE